MQSRFVCLGVAPKGSALTPRGLKDLVPQVSQLETLSHSEKTRKPVPFQGKADLPHLQPLICYRHRGRESALCREKARRVVPLLTTPDLEPYQTSLTIVFHPPLTQAHESAGPVPSFEMIGVKDVKGSPWLRSRRPPPIRTFFPLFALNLWLRFR